ncbi:hypothetical protein I350_03303 [Cryptococcus amylolentus CBS 6273]|uniref:BTB domain-containing protein n=1 Tax=Cryptococcus amylolentus CBS 6273 TaxID=1296118 RepID=A0A1E3K3U5_9TREE|nr:hypothetical protein I350_03303 [Cryptococcus amylolentus CBS 6273]
MGDIDKAEIKVHPDWKDEVPNANGDTDPIATTVTLVSSDEVHFHVPRYLLMANSPVLKDMLSVRTTNNSQKVEFSDDAPNLLPPLHSTSPSSSEKMARSLWRKSTRRGS